MVPQLVQIICTNWKTITQLKMVRSSLIFKYMQTNCVRYMIRHSHEMDNYTNFVVLRLCKFTIDFHYLQTFHFRFLFLCYLPPFKFKLSEVHNWKTQVIKWTVSFVTQRKSSTFFFSFTKKKVIKLKKNFADKDQIPNVITDNFNYFIFS